MRPCHLIAAAASFCLTASALQAAPRCQDQPVFDLEALKSEMMVLATSCHDDTQYNAFINRFHPELIANEKALDSYFKRLYGRRAQSEHDSFVTSLANAQSSEGLRQGTDFCPRNGALFTEAMAVQNLDLPAFAAGKDLIPASMEACKPSEPTPARSTTRVATKKPVKK